MDFELLLSCDVLVITYCTEYGTKIHSQEPLCIKNKKQNKKKECFATY